MTTFTKQKLSGSTDGMGILVDATGDPGTTIHTAVAGTSAFDEIWLYAFNSDTVSNKLTIEFGGNTDPNNMISVVLASQSGLVPIIPGLILQNSAVIKAFAETANKVTITGFINNIA